MYIYVGLPWLALIALYLVGEWFWVNRLHVWVGGESIRKGSQRYKSASWLYTVLVPVPKGENKELSKVLQATKRYIDDVYFRMTNSQVKSASPSYDGGEQKSSSATVYIYAVGDMPIGEGNFVKCHFNLVVDHANELAIMSYNAE